MIWLHSKPNHVPLGIGPIPGPRVVRRVEGEPRRSRPRGPSDLRPQGRPLPRTPTLDRAPGCRADWPVGPPSTCARRGRTRREADGPGAVVTMASITMDRDGIEA